MPGQRLVFIDNLRASAICMVVVMHAAVTYSPFGSWYFREHAPLGLPAMVGFAAYQSFQHAVAMGLLFGIAGYFAGAAVDRKGPAGFLRERASRLGLPLLAYMLVIGPVTEFFIAGSWRTSGSFGAAWVRHLADGEVLGESGPLWFCLVLLGFSVGYAGLRRIRPLQPDRTIWDVPPLWAVLAYGAAMAVLTFGVGVLDPAGGTLLNVDVHDFPQYPLMFVAGVMAWRHDWLRRIGAGQVGAWLGGSLLASVALWALLVAFGGALDRQVAYYGGGWHWQAAGMAVWRSMTCLTVSIGLIALARERFNRQGPLARFLTKNAFGVYVFHPPVLIAVTRAMHEWPIGVAMKFALASVAGILLTFLFVGIIARRMPLLRVVL